MSTTTTPSSLGDLLNDTYQEANGYVDQANSLLGTFSSVFFVDTVNLAEVATVSDDYNNRASYLWLGDVFTELETATNRVIKLFNSNGLVTPPDYTDMDPIKLWKPYSTGLSTYIDSISSNFNTLSNTYSKLNEAIEPFIN